MLSIFWKFLTARGKEWSVPTHTHAHIRNERVRWGQGRMDVLYFLNTDCPVVSGMKATLPCEQER